MTDWHTRAACLGMPTADWDPWYPPSDIYDPPGAARRICAGCPVRRLCAQEALDTREKFGVRAGVWLGRTKESLALARAQLRRIAAGAPPPSAPGPWPLCRRGHPKTPDNVREETGGVRCRTCDREYRQRRRKQGMGKSA